MALLRKLSAKKGGRRDGPDPSKPACVPCDDDEEQTDTAVSSVSDIGDAEFTTVYIYRLSCPLGNPEIGYEGDTERPMANALLDHYEGLWDALQERREVLVGRGRVRFCFAGEASEEGDFGHSPLGQHLLEHCRDVQSKADLIQWCQDNVRVQVRMHKYEARKSDGTFKFSQDAREFVKNKLEREREWEETQRRADIEKEERMAANSELNKRKITKVAFGTIWRVRYNELKEYAAAHGGDTDVPESYPPNVLLGRWVANQRVQYKLKRYGLDANPALTDAKEALLNDIGFEWPCIKPKSRNDGLSIAVMYGYTIDDFNAASGSGADEPNIDDFNAVPGSGTDEPNLVASFSF